MYICITIVYIDDTDKDVDIEYDDDDNDVEHADDDDVDDELSTQPCRFATP